MRFLELRRRLLRQLLIHQRHANPIQPRRLQGVMRLIGRTHRHYHHEGRHNRKK